MCRDPGTADTDADILNGNFLRYRLLQCEDISVEAATVLTVQCFGPFQFEFQVTGDILRTQKPAILLGVVLIILLRILKNDSVQRIDQFPDGQPGAISHPGQIDTAMGVDAFGQSLDGIPVQRGVMVAIEDAGQIEDIIDLKETVCSHVGHKYTSFP